MRQLANHGPGDDTRGMCNRYVAPAEGDMKRYWEISRRHPWPRDMDVFPRSAGPFLRAIPGESNTELVVGQWGLIPWFAKAAKLRYSTNNARFEELAQKASYKQPWARGQRCIIPASMFYEPCWETGKNVWWQFGRADGQPWGLAGLWNTWLDKETGEMVESYTMFTLNADRHPLMSRMHKPDPKLLPDQQDKRSVVPIERSDVETWLNASVDEAAKLVRLAPLEIFDAEALG